jgi:hypothetical protein
MTVMEADSVVDVLKGHAKSKNPTIYLVERNGGVYVYLLPKKKRELECVPDPSGDTRWMATPAELKEQLPTWADLTADDFSWCIL